MHALEAAKTLASTERDRALAHITELEARVESLDDRLQANNVAHAEALESAAHANRALEEAEASSERDKRAADDLQIQLAAARTSRPR